MNTFHLIVTAGDKTYYDGDAQSAIIPGSAGEMTIYANHEPLVSTLKDGNITVLNPDGTESKFGVESGIVEISKNRAVVLI